MEKRRPTYDLRAIQRVAGNEVSLAMTTVAAVSAAALGFDRSGVAEVIRSISPTMFYKSMTTFKDHRVWQDVYHVPVSGLVLYIKFQRDVIAEFQVMSFKEK